ncbi:glycosyltransferase [Sphingobacterium paucimobilis]|uniref:Glycosyl transferase family 1 domain-containing protein n=1 Tax=Sphingobacterium paucimobilis HER1398 TaxID=1346330 RepID=U2HFV6_9SPHI|nr:glycosyltransferase [Sphingobacterium paucimobilis]ERJ60636.1 hypothetical protein M472_17915 [Sphingobacterium paucimobilis HER1398]
MKIYVFCPDSKEIRGGIKQLYTMVDRLNEYGYDACLIHSRPSALASWFHHDTKHVFFPYLFFLLRHIIIKKDTHSFLFKLKKWLFINKELPEKDAVIVFPEVYGPDVVHLLPQNPFVIFNQNCYLTFHLFNFNENRKSPYLADNLLGAVVVSEDSKRYLQYVYPLLSVQRIYLGLDPCFMLGMEKKKKIAFMPRKLSEDALQVINIIQAKSLSIGWEIVAIEDKSEFEVAEELQDTMIFLSFNDQEGFGLPPVEAMACGCYVIGYMGRAGVEYFKEEFCSPILERNVIEFADTVGRTIAEFDCTPQITIEKGRTASQFVHQHYNAINAEDSLKTAWEKLLVKK